MSIKKDTAMLAPRYYPAFHCLADRCTSSCCVDWEIDVDDEARARLLSLDGALGRAVAKSLVCDEGGTHFALTHEGRCPHLDACGLCRIIREKGEDAVPRICRLHPRFFHTVGGGIECGLGACCEEAARLILSEPDYATLLPVVGECGLDPLEATAAAFDPRPARAHLFALLGEPSLAYGERLRRMAAQYRLSPLDKTAHAALFEGLEYLDEAHAPLLTDSFAPPLPKGQEALACERMLAYFLYRHASPAENERELAVSVALSLLLEQIFRALTLRHGLEPIEAARLLSEELEYSLDNTDALRFGLECALLWP